MRILNIDTDLLRSSISVAERTADSITDASSLLNQIVVHNDWACEERNQINQYTVENREKAHEIQEKATSFYHAVRNASERFDEAEQNIKTRTNSVDGTIARIVNVVPGSVKAWDGYRAVCMSDFNNLFDSTEG